MMMWEPYSIPQGLRLLHSDEGSIFMISFIHGILAEKEDGYIVVEAGGVGYGINVPLSVLAQLPTVGEEIKVYTHYAVKEDGQSLYGFLFREDREMFRRLISVNGVGPKGALAILSALEPDDLRLAIVTGDVKSISLSADKSLAGAYTVDMSADTWSAVAAVSEDAAGVTLTGQDGGNLAAGPYYLVVLPGEYGSMTLTVTLADGTTGTYSSKSPLSVAAHDIKEVTVDANDFVSGEFGFEPSEDLRFGYQGTTKTYTVNAPAGTAWTLEADSDDVVLGATEGTGTRSVKVTLPYSKYINDKTYTLTLSADGQASKTLTITQDPFADPVGYPDLSGFTLTAKYGAAYVKSKDYWKYGTFEWTFSNVNLTSGYFVINNWGADGITMTIRFGGDAAVNTVYLKGYLTINGVNVYWGVDRGSSNGGDGDFKNLPCNNVSLGELHSMKLEITPDTRSGYQQNNILNRKLWINDEVVFEFSKTNYPETESARPGDPVDWCGGDIWQSGSTHPGLQYQFGIGGAGKGSITIDSFEYTPYE